MEGFAKIGFAEMEELLSTATSRERERWAQELGALRDSPLKPIALVAFYTAWLDLKPDEAIPALRRFPDLLYRGATLDALCSAIPSELLPQVLDVISELSEFESRTLVPIYLTALAQTDPVATARFIDSHPKLVTSSDVSVLVSAWAKDDVESARKWLESSAFFHNYEALRSLVDSWLAKDPIAARNYVVLHRDTQEIGEAANSVAAHLFNSSPEQAGEFINLFHEDKAASILSSLVSLVNKDQIARLTKWAATLPTAVTEGSMGFALARWSNVDPTEALDWLRQRPPAERDSLVAQLVGISDSAVSAEVVTLAFKIGDPQKREETLSLLVASFASGTEDPTERIRALGLTPAQTRHLLELRRSLPQ